MRVRGWRCSTWYRTKRIRSTLSREWVLLLPRCQRAALLYATMRAGTLRMCLAAQYSSVPFSPHQKNLRTNGG